MFVQCSPSRKSTGPRRVAGLVDPRLVGRALSLCVAASLLSSCIVDEPPDFEDPERTAPILYLDKSDPPNNTFVQVSADSTLKFNVVLQSEDLREPLVAIPWVNFGLENEHGLTPHQVTPGSGSTPREAPFVVTIDSQVPRGCVPLTIFFAHEDDVDFFGNKGALPKPGALSTRATWWLLVDSEPQEVTFADCPQPSANASTGGGSTL